MDKDQQARNTHQDEARFLAAFDELTYIKDTHVANKLSWTRYHAREQRLYFRVVGILLIAFSVTIPFLTTLEGFWKTIVLPIVALLVAGLTGLNAFFHWENHWQGYVQMRNALENQLSVWELKMTAAKHESDVNVGIQKAYEATNQLLENAKIIMGTETDEFFKLVQAPHTHIGPR